MWVAGALIVSYAGIWAHEFYRVPASFGFTPEGALSLLLPAGIIFLTWWRIPQSVGPTVAMGALGLIHLLGGSMSVLPLPFLPFVPEQTVLHYLVHVVYAVAQLPLLVLVALLARRRVELSIATVPKHESLGSE